jgi:hypothetical protein
VNEEGTLPACQNNPRQVAIATKIIIATESQTTALEVFNGFSSTDFFDACCEIEKLKTNIR